MRFTKPAGAQLVALVVALCLVAGVVGWRIGRGFPPGRDAPEVAFMFDMIGHHEQAIAMSQIELANGTDPDVQVFAEEIIRFQSYEIGLMERFLAERGHTRYDAPGLAMAWMDDPVPRDSMPGMASGVEMDGLRSAGEDTDAWFVALMVDHHAGGVAMLAAVLEHTDGDLRDLVERMRTAQESEIAELLRAAERGGHDVPPDGVTWEVYGIEGSHGHDDDGGP